MKPQKVGVAHSAFGLAFVALPNMKKYIFNFLGHFFSLL